MGVDSRGCFQAAELTGACNPCVPSHSLTKRHCGQSLIRTFSWERWRDVAVRPTVSLSDGVPERSSTLPRKRRYARLSWLWEGAGLSVLEGERERDDLLAELRERSIIVEAPILQELTLKDAGDRRLVEAAHAGGARYLVTADREVLRMWGYGGVEFVTSGEFLRVLSA